MVLQEALSSSESFIEDAPSSDIDPYASSSDSQYASSDSPSGSGAAPTAQEITLDIGKLPKPITLFGAGSINPQTISAIRDQYQFATGLLQRPLRQEEADALAYHFARGLQVASYGAPIGLTLGSLLAYRGRDKWKFPMYTPKEGVFNPDAFGPLKGPRARLVWSALRYQAYGFVGFLLGGIFFSSYAVSINAAGKATDVRLRDFNSALNERMKAGKMNEPLRPMRGQMASVNTQEGKMDQQVERVRKDILNQPRGQGSRRTRQDDDMSPTSGAFAGDYQGTSSDTGLLSDSQMRSQELRQQADEQSSPTESRANTFDMDKVTTQPRNFSGDDDASPTADSGRSLPAGSAWERIRREAAAGHPPSRTSPSAKDRGKQDRETNRPAGIQREQRDGSTLGDSFAFSSTDEERQLAKSEAQQDFDARLERERQGGDFNEDKRKRW